MPLKGIVSDSKQMRSTRQAQEKIPYGVLVPIIAFFILSDGKLVALKSNF